MAKVRSHELRSKKRTDLLKQVDELKSELQTLRVAQVTNGAASKLGKIRSVRKNIARVLTVINQKSLEKAREEFPGATAPKKLRVKKTRAIRRALTKEQAAKVTLKANKKAKNNALRKYALSA